MSHGAYLPANIRYSWWKDPDTGKVNRDHHLVYLVRLPPGRQRAPWVKIGELRRYRLTGRSRRYWRAFSDLGLEYPPVFEDPGGHYRALEYLKHRWETGLMPE